MTILAFSDPMALLCRPSSLVSGPEISPRADLTSWILTYQSLPLHLRLGAYWPESEVSAVITLLSGCRDGAGLETSLTMKL